LLCVALAVQIAVQRGQRPSCDLARFAVIYRNERL
jgi:hypothetical protein